MNCLLFFTQTLDESEEITTVKTEVDQSDESTDVEDDINTASSMNEMSEDTDMTEPQIEGGDFENNEEIDIVTTLAPHTSSDEVLIMIPETDADQTDEIIDEDIDMTTAVPFVDEIEPIQD